MFLLLLINSNIQADFLVIVFLLTYFKSHQKAATEINFLDVHAFFITHPDTELEWVAKEHVWREETEALTPASFFRVTIIVHALYTWLKSKCIQ